MTDKPHLGLMFLDYHFRLIEDSRITFDKVLNPNSLNVKEGEVFKVLITESDQVVLQKQRT